MVTRVQLPSDVCLHRKETWEEYAVAGGIDMNIPYFFYFDFQTKHWIIFQESVDSPINEDSA